MRANSERKHPGETEGVLICIKTSWICILSLGLIMIKKKSHSLK